MNPVFRRASDVAHFILWNCTPPEFAHRATIKMLVMYECFWLKPLDCFWTGWREFWTDVLLDAEERKEDRR